MSTIVQKWKEPKVPVVRAVVPPAATPPNIGYQERQGKATRWNPFQNPCT